MSILSFAEPYNDLQYNITTPRTHMEMMIMCNGKAPDQMPLSYWVNVHKRWVAMKKRYHHKFQFFCQTHELNERKGAWKFKAEQFRINFVVSKDSVSELFCVKHVWGWTLEQYKNVQYIFVYCTMYMYIILTESRPKGEKNQRIRAQLTEKTA